MNTAVSPLTQPPPTATETLIWLGHRRSGSGPLYQVPMGFDIGGELDPDRFVHAFDELLLAEPCLRTVFDDHDGTLRRTVLPGIPDGAGCERLERPDAAPGSWLESESRRVTINPEVCPFRAALIGPAHPDADHPWQFLLTISHLVCDSMTFSLLLGRLSQIYSDLENGSTPTPPTRPSFTSYAELEQRLRTPAAPKNTHHPTFTPCHFYATPVALPGPAAIRVERPLPSPRPPTTALDSTFKDAVRIVSALAAYLHRVAGHSSPTIGITVPLRSTPALRTTCGPLVQILPFQVDVHPGDSFDQLRARVSSAYRDLVAGARPGDNSAASQHSFDIVCNLVTNDFEPFAGRPLTARWMHPGSMEPTQRLHLNFHDFNRTGTWQLAADFNLGVFPDEAQRDAFFHHFFSLLDARGQQPIAAVSLASDPAALSTLSGAASPPPPTTRLEASIGNHAVAHPDHPAVIAAGSTLTYAELWSATATLAARISQAAPAGANVAVALPRSADAVVAIVAVLRSGRTFVPLPPDTPNGRAAHVLSECAISVAVVGDSQPGWLSTTTTIPVHATGDTGDTGAPPPPTTDTPAYVLYTSGSTGLPKGVVCRHAPVWNLLLSMERRAPLHGPAPCFWWTNITFDVAIYEVFSALCFGRSLVVTDNATRLDISACTRALDTSEIASAYLPRTHLPALRDALRDGRCRSLRRLLVGVEPISLQLLSQIVAANPALTVVNGYGPTEATVCSTLYNVPAGDTPDTPAPIGTPVFGAHLVVADPTGNPVPTGAIGELWIAGAGLADGYQNQPDLTASKFVDHTITGCPSQRFYHSGDLVRLLPTGDLQFVGRTDDQLKWQGFRIEPAEIQHALEAITGASESAVVVHQQSLVAFIAGAAHDNERQILDALADRLPPAMLPARIVSLTELPRSSNGKIDRARLVDHILDTAPAPTGPASATVQRLAAIWSDLLPGVAVTASTHFIHAGGDSMDAMRMAAGINRTFATEVTMETILRNPVLSQLAEKIDAAHHPATSIPPLASGAIPLLAPNQRPLYAASQTTPESPAYNVVSAHRLHGTLDPAAVTLAFNQVARRHAPLRTTFSLVAGQPIPHITTGPDLHLETLTCPAADLETRARSAASTPFLLHQAPLARLVWLRPDRDGPPGLLVFIAHHLIVDEWSVGIFWRELAAALDRPLPTPPPTVCYQAYAAWQHAKLESDLASSQRAFWRHRLAAPPTASTIPGDLPGLPHTGAEPGALTPVVHLSSTETSALRSRVADSGHTLFPAVVLAFATLLDRHSAGHDVIVGSPVTNRSHPELADLIGFFLVTLPLRFQLAPDLTVAGGLSLAGDTIDDALRHADLPLDQILSASGSPRRTPFATAVVFAAADASTTVTLHGNRLDPVQLDTGTAKFDLTLFAFESGDQLHLQLEFRTGLYSPHAAAQILAALRQLLVGIAGPATARLADLPLRDARQRTADLALCHGEKLAPDHPPTVTASILAAAARTPTSIALRDGPTSLTYAELDRRSAALAAHLAARDDIGSTIGIHLPRGTDAIVALLGTLRAGLAYVPLDPEYPSHRLGQYIATAGINAIITSPDNRSPLPPDPDRVEILLADIPVADTTGIDRSQPGSPAYILFTSGSGGKPKGVVISHQNLAASTAARFQFYPAPPSRFLLVSSLSFDSSVAGIFWTLSAGATLVLMPPRQEQHIAGLAALVAAEKISHTLCLPTLYSLLLNHADPADLATLDTVIVAGEQCPAALPELHHATLPDTSLYNEYGPTEATVWATAHQIQPAEHPVPIGRPVPGAQVYLLDPRRRPVPPGTTGEIAIGGPGVASGYVDDPTQSSRRFVDNPFDPDAGSRLYLTGDLARQRPDGSLVFLGRSDRQVKINGQRFELAEVDAALLSHPDVAAAAAVVQTSDQVDSQKIVAALLALDPAESSRILTEFSISHPQPE